MRSRINVCLMRYSKKSSPTTSSNVENGVTISFFKKTPLSFLKSIVGYLSLVIDPGHSFFAKLTW